jgi:hypothetical protein
MQPRNRSGTPRAARFAADRVCRVLNFSEQRGGDRTPRFWYPGRRESHDDRHEKEVLAHPRRERDRILRQHSHQNRRAPETTQVASSTAPKSRQAGFPAKSVERTAGWTKIALVAICRGRLYCHYNIFIAEHDLCPPLRPRFWAWLGLLRYTRTRRVPPRRLRVPLLQ